MFKKWATYYAIILVYKNRYKKPLNGFVTQNQYFHLLCIQQEAKNMLDSYKWDT